MLKIGFLVLLYLFIWRIVRTASRDLRAPQESLIIAPRRGPVEAAAPSAAPAGAGRLVVLSSPVLATGEARSLDSATVTAGRAPQNDLALDGDDFASASHARFEPRRDGVWVVDQGSTNGTFVNGKRLSGPQRLKLGDVIRIGQTDLRFER